MLIIKYYLIRIRKNSTIDSQLKRNRQYYITSAASKHKIKF